MGWWSERVVPRMVERTCGDPAFRPLRELACAGLAGRVVEVGYGSGRNTRFYPDAVTDVLAVEPSDLAWGLSERRRASSGVPVTRAALDGRRLPLDDDSADAVLCTFTLCTIPDVGAALAEAGRVLRPGGALHFAEHGLSPEPRISRWQRRLDGLEQRLAGGCHLTRDVPALLRTAGFEVSLDHEGYVDLPAVARPWTWCTAGRALAPR